MASWPCASVGEVAMSAMSSAKPNALNWKPVGIMIGGCTDVSREWEQIVAPVECACIILSSVSLYIVYKIGDSGHPCFSPLVGCISAGVSSCCWFSLKCMEFSAHAL